MNVQIKFLLLLLLLFHDFHSCLISAQVPDMSSPGNSISWIMSIEPLIGANYPQWREKINMGLALFEIDKAITDKRLVEPTLLDIPSDLGADAKVE
jgi:hypothetical protein